MFGRKTKGFFNAHHVDLMIELVMVFYRRISHHNEKCIRDNKDVRLGETRFFTEEILVFTSISN